MKTTILRAGVRHRLIQQIITQSRPSGSAISRGFTLIELLVVVIIVGTLAAIALPSFLNQGDKAKVAGAKALANASAKECQVFMMNPADPPYNGTWAMQTASGDETKLTIEGPTCTTNGGGEFTATIKGGKFDGDTVVAVVDENGGVVITDNTGGTSE